MVRHRAVSRPPGSAQSLLLVALRPPPRVVAADESSGAPVVGTAAAAGPAYRGPMRGEAGAEMRAPTPLDEPDGATGPEDGGNPAASAARTASRWALAGLLAFTGTGPPGGSRALPGAGAALAARPRGDHRSAVISWPLRSPWSPFGGDGRCWAGSSPGSSWQSSPANGLAIHHRADAFGLETDTARAVRLLIQPLFVAWALWCTGAWHRWRAGTTGAAPSSPPGAEVPAITP